VASKGVLRAPFGLGVAGAPVRELGLVGGAEGELEGVRGGGGFGMGGRGDGEGLVVPLSGGQEVHGLGVGYVGRLHVDLLGWLSAL